VIIRTRPTAALSMISRVRENGAIEAVAVADDQTHVGTLGRVDMRRILRA
jgi:hypothetical protein